VFKAGVFAVYTLAWNNKLANKPKSPSLSSEG